MENKTPQRTYSITHFDRTVAVRLETSTYHQGGGLAVQLVEVPSGEDYATVSVNVGCAALADDEFVFRAYPENEGLFEELLRVGAVALTGRESSVGPVCRLLAAA